MRRSCARAILILSTIFWGAHSHIAAAVETVTYQYDVLGRLSASSISGGTMSGTQVTTSFDLADNRITQSTIGVPALPPSNTCTFAARDTEGNDEFTVYPYIERTGTCVDPVTVSYVVTEISGTGRYLVLEGFYGYTFQPTDQYKNIRVQPYYCSVSSASPLILAVDWTITSGPGVITQTRGIVKIFSAGC